MGACGACADNIAQYYAKKPRFSLWQTCKASSGRKPEAIKELVAFPDYCKVEVLSSNRWSRRLTEASLKKRAGA